MSVLQICHSLYFLEREVSHVGCYLNWNLLLLGECWALLTLVWDMLRGEPGDSFMDFLNF